MRPLVLALTLATSPTLLFADDKPDVAALKKQLAEAEAKVSDLKAQLAKAQGVPAEFTDISEIRKSTAKVGVSGKFITGATISEIIDDSTAILSITEGSGTGTLGGPIRMSYTTWYVVARDYPTKGLVDGVRAENARFAITGTEKINGQTMFVVRPVNSPKQAELKADVPAQKPAIIPENKPEPKLPPPFPTATITPPKGETVPLAEAQYFIAAVQKEPGQLAKWVKDGKVKLLTAPTEVQVVSRDKEYGKVIIDGKEWVVESKWLPPEKK